MTDKPTPPELDKIAEGGHEDTAMWTPKKIIVSAPSKSGFRAEFDSVADARTKAADLLGVDLGAMVEVEGDGATYCYGTQADANSDRDGAYAVKYGSEV